MPWVTATIQNIFNVVLRAQTASPAFPTAGSLYLGLWTSATTPTLEGGSVTEVTTTQLTGYARKVITLLAPSGTNRSVVSTTPDALFSSSAAGTGFPYTIRYGGLYSAITGGTPLAYGRLASDLSVTAGSLVSIPAGNLTITDDSVAP